MRRLFFLYFPVFLFVLCFAKAGFALTLSLNEAILLAIRENPNN